MSREKERDDKADKRVRGMWVRALIRVELGSRPQRRIVGFEIDGAVTNRVQWGE
jgi:hypothetical protein